MTNYPYILFNKAPLQLRLIGARGGRTFGRNQRIRRARLALLPTPPQTAPLCAAPQPTTADAIALAYILQNPKRIGTLAPIVKPTG